MRLLLLAAFFFTLILVVENSGIEISYPDGNQLLFYPKDQLINRLSFVHVVWTMDLQGPINLLKNVTTDLDSRFKAELRKSNKPIKKFDLENNVSSVWNDNTLQDLYSEKHLDGAVVCLTLLEMFYRLYHQLDSLLRSVPEKYDVSDDLLNHQRMKREDPDDEVFSFIDDPTQLRCLNTNSSLERFKREILGGAALGISVWNSYRISNIESHFANLSSKYNVLVDSVQLLGAQHNQLAADVELMKRLIHIISSNNYRKILASAISTSSQIQNTVENVVSIVTSGRQRRISPRLINGDSLAELFLNLKKKAAELDSELLLVHPTDIYDVQASYGYSQSGLLFKIYAHIPMASKSETLALFEHIPFPMAFQSMMANATITPVTGLDKYLAVLPTESSPDGHKYRVLSESEFQGCFKLRDYYLCSNRNTLRLDIRSSCIGSLWMQDHTLVLQNCKLKIEPLQEVAVKTSPRQWLVFSPELLIRSVKCGKRTVQSLRFERQTLISLIDDCEVTLLKFVLSTDTNVLMDFKILTHEWRYFGSIFSPSTLDEDDINKAFDEISLSKGKYGIQNLDHLKHYFEASSNSINKLWDSISNLNLFSWFGNVYMFLFYIFIIWLFVVALMKGWFKKCCFPKKKILSRDSSIARPLKTPIIRYTAPPPLSKSAAAPAVPTSPPSYNSIVNASAPLVPVETENEGLFSSSNNDFQLYPSLPARNENARLYPTVSIETESERLYPSIPSVPVRNENTRVYPTISTEDENERIFPAAVKGDKSGAGANLLCYVKHVPANQSVTSFVCHHHDPINGCNGSFGQKKKKCLRF